jgi:hypothetical protein
MRVSVCVCVCVCVCTYVYLYVYVYVHVCMYVHLCVYVRMCVCAHLCEYELCVCVDDRERRDRKVWIRLLCRLLVYSREHPKYVCR